VAPGLNRSTGVSCFFEEGNGMDISTPYICLAKFK
jgi:hypothetical protein